MACQNLATLGFGASIYQVNPAKLEVALRAVQAEPVFMVNGVPHWRDIDIDAAVEWLRGEGEADE